MKRIFAVLVIMSTAACAGPGGAAPNPVRSWSRDGLNMPESAHVDSSTGALFVSQIVGAPDGKDGQGWISKLDLDGTLKVERWVAGFNAPKGLGSHGGRLWVSDIDTLVSIDIATAKVVKRIKIDGAMFLNDVVCGPDGTVYVSDMMGNRIHRFRNDTLSVFAEGDHLEHPNGLLVTGGKLVVGGWGSPIAADFSTKTPGHLYALDLSTGKKTLITPKPTGNLDGVASDGKGGYIVSDWIAGKVFRIGGDGRTRVLFTRPKGTADLTYLPAKGLLILPEMLEGRVTAFPLK